MKINDAEIIDGEVVSTVCSMAKVAIERVEQGLSTPIDQLILITSIIINDAKSPGHEMDAARLFFFNVAMKKAREHHWVCQSMAVESGIPKATIDNQFSIMELCKSVCSSILAEKTVLPVPLSTINEQPKRLAQE